MLDLIRKLAKLNEEQADPNPDEWYRRKFDHTATYSEVIDALAKTPEERQQLLRAYMEPNDQEREEGDKQPTAAHRAISALAAQGFIRVILTTNFDRLMETALADEGITPVVLSSTDQIRGALPLIHTQCCIVKVHGDYLDTRIRNSPAELDEYPTELNQLLDRIFDEFGLIVCGWSAEWDGALCSALFRASSRRFTTYWTVRAEPREKVEKLIQHRGATAIKIRSADDFFQSLSEYVQSIEEYSKPHPLSVEAAVFSLKRYIAEPRFRIQLSDLIQETVEHVVQMTSGSGFDVQSGSTLNSKSITNRVRNYDAACHILLALAFVGGAWSEEEHYTVWRRAFERLGSRRADSGIVVWLNLQRYPATLLLYALGIGAVEADRLGFFEQGTQDAIT